jgi:hypothetical protein
VQKEHGGRLSVPQPKGWGIVIGRDFPAAAALRLDMIIGRDFPAAAALRLDMIIGRDSPAAAA